LRIGAAGDGCAAGRLTPGPPAVYAAAVAGPTEGVSFTRSTRRAPAPAEHTTADPGEVMRTCPVCGKPLAERKCKLFCPDPVCGYYLSCADFY
jgi:hypothetical protein